jgi:hypothetical protein
MPGSTLSSLFFYFLVLCTLGGLVKRGVVYWERRKTVVETETENREVFYSKGSE